MAEICPFRGVRYNPMKVPLAVRGEVSDLSAVITQPYDRIGPELQARYYDLHPNNYVRLILNRHTPADTVDDNAYARASIIYRNWLTQGILVKDRAPALYVYHQTFHMPDGSVRTRKALLTTLRLTGFDEGVVLPHERTLSGPKVDRLNLFRATGVNFEPVFLLYPDAENRVNALLDAAIEGVTATVEAHELCEADVQQQMWVVTDQSILAQVVETLKPMRNLIIADGHHRYETALNYRDEMRARETDRSAAAPPSAAGSPAPYEYVLVALVSMSDPGLVILPTHRLVHSYTYSAVSCNKLGAEQLLTAAAPYFDISPVAERAALQQQVISHVNDLRTVFGFVTADRCYLWQLKDAKVMDDLASDHVRAWRELDVSILHELVLERLLGLTKDSIARKENLDYLRDPQPGFDALDAGRAQFLFLLNPTRMSQVAECARMGEKMPQKSTDFYPKMISGLVTFPLLD